MRLNKSYFYTLREDAKDEDSISSNLLVKAGYIKKVSSGVYMLLPLGQIVADKIEQVVRKHMNATGAQEVKMPALIASEYYEKSGRLDNFGPSVFRLQDRSGKEMILGPTHEELFAYSAKSVIHSYKDMPFNIYQIQSKYRDEPRARFGLIRVKEFVMKDAYSFDINEEELGKSYQKMYDAYVKIFDELALDYRIVKADTGVMGGLLSEEFQALSEIGEDTLVYCDCGYSENDEIATRGKTEVEKENNETIKEIDTPNVKTIEELCAYLNTDSKRFVKTLIYKSEKEVVAVVVRGNREVCESKLLKALKVNEVEMADPITVEEVTGAPVGFAGPVNLNCRILVDEEVVDMRDFIVGANKKDTHLIHVNPSDFSAYEVFDLKLLQEGDLCPNCGKKLKFAKGIEVGNCFKLGTKYAKALNLNYLDQDNKQQDVWMGSYGIGIGRTMAAIVEQHHDDKGIAWPEDIAPYKVGIVIVSDKDEAQVKLAEELYTKLLEKGIEVVYDDREERAGVKFNDMELIGIPHRLTVGRKASEGLIEYKERNGEEAQLLTIQEVLNKF